MNFLTIEKFQPHQRTGLLKKIMLGLLMLVVLTILLAAWAWSRLTYLEFSQTSPAAKEVTSQEKNIIAVSDYN